MTSTEGSSDDDDADDDKENRVTFENEDLVVKLPSKCNLCFWLKLPR